jgi:hypothetical protein
MRRYFITPEAKIRGAKVRNGAAAVTQGVLEKEISSCQFYVKIWFWPGRSFCLCWLVWQPLSVY